MPLSSVDPALAPFDDVLIRGLERDPDLQSERGAALRALLYLRAFRAAGSRGRATAAPVCRARAACLGGAAGVIVASWGVSGLMTTVTSLAFASSSVMVPAEPGWTALRSEGGHVTFSPANETEVAILQFAWREFDHVSAERFLSGLPGLRLIGLDRDPTIDLDSSDIEGYAAVATAARAAATIAVLEGDETGQELLEEALRVLDVAGAGVVGGGRELERPRADSSIDQRDLPSAGCHAPGQPRRGAGAHAGVDRDPRAGRRRDLRLVR